MNELVPQSQSLKCKFTSNGLIIEEEITFEEWDRIGVHLFEVRRALPMLVGDWLNEGEKRYGESYSQAKVITGLESGTLAHYKSAAGRVSKEVRQDDLNYSHYRLVTKLEPPVQLMWLKRAKEEDWTAEQLKEAMAPQIGQERPKTCHFCEETKDLAKILVCRSHIEKMEVNG